MKFVVVLGVLILAVVTNAGVSMNNPFFCYTTDPIRSMTNMHSIATSYQAIRRFNFTTVNPYITTCEPSRIWYLGRYGGRFPHAPLLEDMIEFAESSIQDDIVRNYEAGRTTLCRSDFEALRDWSMGSDFDIENASRATEAGIIAMQNIAYRYQQHYPDILTADYSPERFLFRHTHSERTNTSIRGIATSLFGTIPALDVEYEEVPEIDWFLRPFDFCPAFTEETANWSAQRDAFREGPEFQEMVEQVNRKLGFTGPNPLSIDTVLLMWEWCRFETGSGFELANDSETGGNATWCAPFSVSHQLLLEYYEDLGHFYFSGYGVRNQRLLENLNCGLMQDLLTHLESDNERVARIFVTYTQEIQSMLVALGSFRDTWPLHQHNYAQQSSRNWLTSLIAPHASNLVAVRHDCEDGDDDLIFLLNERPILVPGCDQQTGVCKVSAFVTRFQRFLEANCEEYFCTHE